MRYKMRPVKYDPIARVIEIHVTCPVDPKGILYTVRIGKEGGGFLSKQEIKEHILAACPVAYFEEMAAHAAKNYDDTHVRELLVEPPFEAELTPQDQGNPQGLATRIIPTA